jgi:hypothetical protein
MFKIRNGGTSLKSHHSRDWGRRIRNSRPKCVHCKSLSQKAKPKQKRVLRKPKKHQFLKWLSNENIFKLESSYCKSCVKRWKIPIITGRRGSYLQLAPWEVEIRRIVVWGQPGANSEDLLLSTNKPGILVHTWNPSYVEGIGTRIIWGWLMRLLSTRITKAKKKKKKKAGGEEEFKR